MIFSASIKNSKLGLLIWIVTDVIVRREHRFLAATSDDNILNRSSSPIRGGLQLDWQRRKKNCHYFFQLYQLIIIIERTFSMT